MWIGGFCIVGASAHAAIFMIRDYDVTFSDRYGLMLINKLFFYQL